MRSTPGKHEQLRHEHPTSVTTRLMPALASPSSATGQARRRAVATSERVELSNGAAHARKCTRSRHVRSRRTRITNACQHAVVDEHHHMISSGDQRQHWKKVFAALPVTSALDAKSSGPHLQSFRIFREDTRGMLMRSQLLTHFQTVPSDCK